MTSRKTAKFSRKHFARSDQIRLELEKMGIILEDTPQGTKWKKKL